MNKKKIDDIICYTGIGAIKTGNHTKKQFLKIMNREFKKKCPEHFTPLRI